MADVAEGASGFLKTKRLTAFQADDVITAYQRDGHALVWDCGCIYGDADIVVNRGGNAKHYKLRDVVSRFNGEPGRYAWDSSIPTYVQREADGVVRLARLVNAWRSGIKQTYVVTTTSGRTIRATDEHPFLTKRGWLRLDELRPGDQVHVRGDQATGGRAKANYRRVFRMQHHPFANRWPKGACMVPEHRLVAEATHNALSYDVFLKRVIEGDIEGLEFLDPDRWEVHHRDHNPLNNELSNLLILTPEEHQLYHAEAGSKNNVLYKIVLEEIVSVDPYGMEETYDLEVEDDPHNFLADGFVVHNTGKSVGAVALAVLCVQDGLVDRVLVVCERNKVREWVADFEADTDLSVRKHHGAGRQRRLERLGVPRVLVTTYETAKSDCAASKGPRSFVPGYLLDALRGQRVLVIYDESTKLRNRSSANYKAHEFILKTLRKEGYAKVLALTATPLEKDYEDGFNQLRLAVPNYMPLVKEFEDGCIRYRDPFGRPVYDYVGVQEFMARVRPHISRRRKTDPDVIDQFPPLTEEYRFVELSQPHMDFYRMAEEVAFEMSEVAAEGGQDIGIWALLRQIAGHPAAIIHSARKEDGSRYAKEIVDVLGEDHLRKIPSAKTEELKRYLSTVVSDQGAKAAVFTFFGQSVLLELERELKEAGFPVFVYHGAQSAHDNEAAKQDFKIFEGGAVFLTSDAGARGINLPEVTYPVEYESALTHAMRIQRRDRAHRINSRLGPVTSMTFIAEGTLEEQIFSSVLQRNEKHDVFAGDLDAGENFVSAADRRMILAEARRRYEQRKKRR